MEPLNYRQLAAKFPVCNNGDSSERAWQKLLLRWREDGKVEERKHWRYGASVEGNNQPTRYYDVVKIVKLVCIEARGKLPRPRVSFLYQEYFDDFSEILTKAAADAAAAKEQAAPIEPAIL